MWSVASFFLGVLISRLDRYTHYLHYHLLGNMQFVNVCGTCKNVVIQKILAILSPINFYIECSLLANRSFFAG